MILAASCEDAAFDGDVKIVGFEKTFSSGYDGGLEELCGRISKISGMSWHLDVMLATQKHLRSILGARGSVYKDTRATVNEW